tara:strand:- start:1093 stop:3345 length:2253 start_codon:yes stop_codon:yes gene_type:complete
MANKAIGFLTFNFGANMQGFDRAMKKAQTKVRRFGKTMKNIGSSMTANITMPILGIGAAGIKMAADFGSSMTKIRTLVGASAEELKSYEKDVLSLSSTTGIAADQLAEGLFFITSAGLSGQEAIDALAVSAKAAAMGMGEMTDIGSALTSVMKAYESDGMDAARAGDLLHETLKQGKFEAGEFMSRLGRVIPTAAAAGIEFEELGAAAATMSKLSGDAASTLTGLNQLMMKLLNPSAEQVEILDTLGMSYGDLASMLDESLMGTLQFLFKELEGTDDMLLKMFGSSKAVTAALSTMGLQSETYTDVLDGMNNSMGNVNEGFDILATDAGFKFQRGLNQVKLVLIDIGNQVMPLVLKGLEKLQAAMSWWGSLDKDMKTFIVTVGLVAAAIGPIISLVGSLGIAFSALLSPIGLAVAAIAGFTVGFAFVRENWEAFKERLSDWSWWRNALLTAVGWVIKFNPIQTLIDSVNSLIHYLGGDPIPDPFEMMREGLDGLKDETVEYENDFGTFAEAMKNQAKDLADALGLLGNPFELGGGSGGGVAKTTSPTAKPKKQSGGFGMFGKDFISEQLAAQESMEKTTSIMDILATNFGITKKVLMEYSQQAKQTLSQGAASFEDYGKVVKNTIKDIIGALIAEGVATAVTKALSSIPPFPGSVFLIPALAGAAAGLARTALNSLIPSFADGGIISGPTVGLMGEYAGANTNPEVVAPLDKLKSMMGGGVQQVEVFGRISGNDIWLTNSKTGINRNRGY